MADLNDKNSSDNVKIVGSDANGAETNYLAVDSSQQALVKDAGANSALASIISNQTNETQKTDLAYALKDAFGRIRTAVPTNVFELVMYKDPVVAEDISTSVLNGGTVVHNATITSLELNVTSTTNSQAIAQTYEYIAYKPGRSQLVKITGNFKGKVADVNKYFGQFDANNGFYFATKGTTAYVGLRSKVTGSVVDTEIAQADWNLDKLDGTGSSGYTIDFSKQQIFVMDYQWQGSGRIRYGFFINDKLVYCHVIYNANINSTPYSQTAILPIRMELINTAASAASMHMTCLAVDSEGEESPVGQLRSVNSGLTLTNYTTVGQRKPVLSIRKKSTDLQYPLQVLEATLFAQSTDDFLLEFVVNGTLTGPSWTANEGIAEFDKTATAITGGQIIFSAYVRGTASNASLLGAEFAKYTRDLSLGHTLAGVSDIFSIVATNLTQSAAAQAVINYRDLK
jgi:hypothetical protein